MNPTEMEREEMKQLAGSLARELSSMITESGWATKFMQAAFFHGLAAMVITVFLVLGSFTFLTAEFGGS